MTYYRVKSILDNTESNEPDGVHRPHCVTIEHGVGKFESAHTTEFHHWAFNDGNDVRIVNKNGELVVAMRDLEDFMAEYVRWRLQMDVAHAERWTLLKHGVEL